MRSTAVGYALLAPSLFGVVTFLLLPMLVVAWLSLHRWDLLGPVRFVGLDNWTSVLTDPSFATSLLVTGVFIMIVVPAQSVLGLVAAAMLAPGLRRDVPRPRRCGGHPRRCAGGRQRGGPALR
jgi:multiple sugar transport system permease protein